MLLQMHFLKVFIKNNISTYPFLAGPSTYIGIDINMWFNLQAHTFGLIFSVILDKIYGISGNISGNLDKNLE